VEELQYLGTNLTIKILFSKKLKAKWSQGMLFLFDAEYFVF
jgi:hypothetical protein